MGSFLYENDEEIKELKKMNLRLAALTSLAGETNALLFKLVDLMQGFVRPRKPSFTLVLIGESNMDLLKFKVVSTADADTEQRELKVTSDGATLVEQTFGKDDAMEFEVAQGSSCRVELTDVDDAGNHSATATKDFVAEDTNVPAAPGEVGLEFLGEREGAAPENPV